MAAAPARAGDALDVDAAAAAQRDLPFARAELAQHGHRLDAGDRAGDVDQTLRVARRRAGGLEHRGRQVHRRDAPAMAPLESRQQVSEQPDRGLGLALVEPLRDRLDPGAGGDQTRRGFERGRTRVGEPESAGVRDQGEIEAARGFGVDAHAQRASELVDHDADRRGFGLHPVDGAVELVAEVVVDVEQRTLAQGGLEAGAVETRALEHQRWRRMWPGIRAAARHRNGCARTRAADDRAPASDAGSRWSRSCRERRARAPAPARSRSRRRPDSGGW